MQKIKILQVNKLYAPVTGGVERVVQQLAEGLKASVDTTVLVCQKKGKGQLDQLNGIKVVRCGSLGVFFSMPLSMSFIAKFRKLSRNHDIIHLHMPFPLGDLALLLSGYKGKVVLWWHSDIVKQKKLLKLYRPLMEWTLRRADVIIVATAGHIKGSDFLKPYRDKCKIIPFGVEPTIMAKSLEYQQRKKTTDTSTTLDFLFVGRLVYYKGCDILIEAFSQANIPQATLTMVGTGPLENDLKSRVKELNLEHKIRFMSNLSNDELADIFANCDVFVLPSVAKSEAFGLVQIEAMAYGKPVINTNLPSGVPYVSLNGITGLTVPPNNVIALSDALKWLADNQDQRIAMGQNALRRVQETYKMESMLSSTLNLYKDLLYI